jgi:1,4-dihydroxy-2-naphthoate octaprenyltransferase
MNFMPSKSSWLHLRFAFSLFLLPVFIFAVSQAPHPDTVKCWIAFFCWHFFIYPASNGYNSYFDKDEDSIALLKSPPKVDKSLYWLSLGFDLIGILLAFFVSLEFVLAVIVYGLLSKLYSHPATRLKKYPVVSFLVVFFFQGAFVYYTSYSAVSQVSLALLASDSPFLIAGLICSCLIGASYPLTQVYQHEEDSKRGDKTLSMLLGVKGSFWFSAALFIAGGLLLYHYWDEAGRLSMFYLFLAFAAPVFGMFVYWFRKVWDDERNANFKLMSRITFLSGTMMLLYFVVVWVWK